MPDVMELIDKQEVRLIESDADAYPQEWNDDYEKGFCDAIHKVLELPTIDAQPVKQGKWEWEPGYVGTTAKCSACGLSPRGFYSLPISQIGRLPEYKFCPNCGAEMICDDADS